MSTTTTHPVPGMPDPSTTARSPHAESPLPAVAATPPPIPGERPTRGVSFGRLVHVELRKMLDTRAGRWLVIGVGAAIATALVILFFVDGGQHPFGSYLQATTMPMAIILPVVGILAVTSEWSQRTGLVTFTMEPRRIRVGWAKFAASMLVGIAAFALAIGLAALAHQAAITFQGITPGWSIGGLVVAGAGLYVLLGLAQGVGFGMLFKNTPAAIVTYFALPTAWGILSSLVTWLDTAARWLNLDRTMNPLFLGKALTGEQWAQLATSVGVWVVLPLVVGMWRLSRAEVK
ncbi:MAG: ABC transporter permease subunit [Intrasporangium sp.]|uniref:ABC transporter permease subunit n=1 Tax=Intrasporangium sp. TaxID=1925024 RepID=UPI002647B56B|nr:ABC transporter permease subunit [Intrasporangium sp.]MDN5797332.1 ABC transporter permease subunit [Intrasporangium sp.]